MCLITKEMSFYWIIGLLLLWSGVITAGNVTAAPGAGTTTSHEISAFIISIKISNHVYNDSLQDQQSQNYKILRQDVENLFFEVYSFTTSAQFQEIAEMTFSNGSVIANSTVLFGTKHKSGQILKTIFVTNYLQHPSRSLDLHINYTADQEPIPVPLHLLSSIPHSITSMTTSITDPKGHTFTELFDNFQSGNESSTTSATISGPEKSTDSNSATDKTPQTQSTTNAHDVTHSNNSNSLLNSSMTTVHPNSNVSTNSSSISSTTTEHPNTNNSNNSSSSPSTTTEHPNSNISTNASSSPSTTTEHPNSNISTNASSSPSTTTEHPNSNISTNASSSPFTTTVHPNSNISTILSSSPSTTTEHPNSNISTNASSSPSTTTLHPNSNISTNMSSSPSTMTEHPNSNISAMSSSSPGKTVTQKPTGPEGSNIVPTEQDVPGWAIAILVLAAVILFFMLVLIILLLLFWCCWWKQRGFMNVSDPDPTGYYNPDIPMYSTHSTYDSHNGKSLVAL